MNKLRDCAIVLGLAGVILMTATDTKDVMATGKISDQSIESSQEGFVTPGTKITEFSNSQIAVFRWEQIIANTKDQGMQTERMAEKIESHLEEQVKEEVVEEKNVEEIVEEIIIEENIEEPEESEIEEVIEEQEPSNRVIDLSDADYIALLKIVEAEASGEDIMGRMLVANVVMNRVRSSKFPNSVEAVVYQREGGKAQFSPVATGKIDRVTVSEGTIEAVERVLCGEDESQGALYFVSRTYASPENLQWFERNLTMLFAYHGHEFYA